MGQVLQDGLNELRMLEEACAHREVMEACLALWETAERAGDSVSEFLLRVQASRTRSEAFCDFSSETEDRLVQLERSASSLQGGTLVMESLVLLSLAASRIARVKGDWRKAKREAKKAKVHLAGLEGSHLEADVTFAIAHALAETESHYLAAHFFGQIASMPQASPERRAAALVNEAWLRFDLGDSAFFSDLSGRGVVLEGYAQRVELVGEMLEWKSEVLLEKARNGFQSSIAQPELPHICFLLCEAILVAKATPGSDWWLVRKLSHISKTRPGFEGRITKLCCEILVGQQCASSLLSTCFSEDQIVQLNWRDQLSVFAVVWLDLLRSGKGGDQEYYEAKIDPILKSKRISPPLLVNIYSKATAENAWQAELRKHADLADEDYGASLLLCPVTKTLLCSQTGASINLIKRPTSWDLLLLLAGKRGDETSKERLHSGLTPSSYNPLMHNNRLNQLLGRLRRLLENQGIASPWYINGGGHIELMRDILIQKQEVA